MPKFEVSYLYYIFSIKTIGTLLLLFSTHIWLFKILLYEKINLCGNYYKNIRVIIKWKRPFNLQNVHFLSKIYYKKTIQHQHIRIKSIFPLLNSLSWLWIIIELKIFEFLREVLRAVPLAHFSNPMLVNLYYMKCLKQLFNWLGPKDSFIKEDDVSWWVSWLHSFMTWKKLFNRKHRGCIMRAHLNFNNIVLNCWTNILWK